MIETIEIRRICTSAGTQSRESISEETVTEYHELLDDTDLPPVLVFTDGINYYLADGFHRVMAYQRASREFIDADVRVGTLRDAIKYSLKANASHGLRRTNADKRKAVKTALADAEWGELNDREIAQMCAVSHVFVNRVRKESRPVNVNKTPDSVNVNKTSDVVKVHHDKTDDLVNVNKPEDFTEDEVMTDLMRENERLMDRLAVESMDATEEDKALAQETIESLRQEVRGLQIELEAVKRSRDQYQLENSEMKKQIKALQRQLKK